MCSNLFFDMNPLDTYFVNQSHNPGKLTFVNASFWEKRTAIHKPRRPFNFDLKTYPLRTILREVSRVSSLILRAKLWLAEKVLRHRNRFAARVRRRYFSEGEKGRPEIRLRFAGYRPPRRRTENLILCWIGVSPFWELGQDVLTAISDIR